eukprot:910711-Prymnesium_polylepis.1
MDIPYIAVLTFVDPATWPRAALNTAGSKGVYPSVHRGQGLPLCRAVLGGTCDGPKLIDDTLQFLYLGPPDRGPTDPTLRPRPTPTRVGPTDRPSAAHIVGTRFGTCFSCPPAARYGAQFRGRLLAPRDFSLPLTG